MTLPHSIYRLQFRNGMDVRRACQLVPYLAQLGISHLHAEIASSRGDLDELAAELDRHSMQLVLGEVGDIRPVAGTTGRAFIAAFADALVDEQEGGRLERAFHPLKDENHRGTPAEQRLAAKRQILTDDFEDEVRHVARLAKSMADQSHADLSRAALSEAICGLIVALPANLEAEIGEQERQLLATARQEAQGNVRPEVREAIDFIWELLIDDRRCAALDACPEFRIRFRQLNGPGMARALEDILLHRENAFIALNETGSDLGRPTGGPAAFHAAMQARTETLPTTSAHDTKRGEDARARLYTLSEAPDLWIAATQRWAALNARFRHSHAGRMVPEPDVEWLLYQSLAGAWPVGGREDRPAMQALKTRMRYYTEKALRAAKTGTSRNFPDIEYEQKVAAFLDDLFAHNAFLDEFADALTPFIAAGLMNALAQVLIKLTAPGIPDIDQGSERGDFSLSDPDDRAPLDATFLHIPQEPQPHFPDYKQWLIATVLAARNRQPNAFSGPYIPLESSDGSRQVLAFLRGTPQAFAVVAVPRLTFGKVRPDALLLLDGVVNGIHLVVPSAFEGRAVRSVLDGRSFTLGSRLPLPDIFANQPVGLLLGE